MGFKEELERIKNNQLIRTKILETRGSACSDILVIAPHNKVHWRDNKYKYSEEDTEYLGKLLYIKNDCSFIYKISSDYEDANRDDLCDMKNEIYKFLDNHKDIKTIIHLHQLAYDREIDIDLGDKNCSDKNKIKIFLEEAKKQNKTIDINRYYQYGSQPNHLASWIKNKFPYTDNISVKICSKNIMNKNYKSINYKEFEKIFIILSESLKQISINNKGHIYGG